MFGEKQNTKFWWPKRDEKQKEGVRGDGRGTGDEGGERREERGWN